MILNEIFGMFWVGRKKTQAGYGGDIPGLLGGRDIKIQFEVTVYQKQLENATNY